MLVNRTCQPQATRCRQLQTHVRAHDAERRFEASREQNVGRRIAAGADGLNADVVLSAAAIERRQRGLAFTTRGVLHLTFASDVGGGQLAVDELDYAALVCVEVLRRVDHHLDVLVHTEVHFWLVERFWLRGHVDSTFEGLA